MAENLFKKLVNGGGFSLPYLLHFYKADKSIELYLVNDTQDCTFENVTYLKSAFSFEYATDGSCTLEIETVENGNKLINLFENSYQFTTEVIGCILENGEVKKLNGFKKTKCSAKWDNKQATITYEVDERMNMTFPALIWNCYNNRGNS